MEKKFTGIVRSFDKLGRLVIPKEIRDTHGWDEVTNVLIKPTENGVFIEKISTKKVDPYQEALKEVQWKLKTVKAFEHEELIYKLIQLVDKTLEQ